MSRARARGQVFVGIQIDYDCPTKRLGEYGRFLERLRAALPPDVSLCVTALLDWFAEPASVKAALAAADEFVPQFYDLGPVLGVRGRDTAPSIAVLPDAVRWRGSFEAVGRPYRIGIGVFGRAHGRQAAVSRGAAAGNDPLGQGLWQDRERLDAIKGLAFEREEVSLALERVLWFRERPDQARGGPGREVAVVLPTPQGLARSLRETGKFGGRCLGAVVFRWPGEAEGLVLTPGEMLVAVEQAAVGPGKGENAASGGKHELAAAQPVLESRGGACPAGRFSDLTIRPGERFLRQAARYRITSSAPLLYFLPHDAGHARQNGPYGVEVSVPAFEGAPLVAAGRAVTAGEATFVLERLP